MKNPELKKLISEYTLLKQKQSKKYTDNIKISNRIKEIEHRYFHEIGRTLKSDLERVS